MARVLRECNGALVPALFLYTTLLGVGRTDDAAVALCCSAMVGLGLSACLGPLAMPRAPVGVGAGLGFRGHPFLCEGDSLFTATCALFHLEEAELAAAAEELPYPTSLLGIVIVGIAG